MKARKVTYAKLHGTAFVPGVGHLGDSLPPTTKSIPLEMTATEEGLNIKVKGVECMIPLTNVQLMVFAPEESKK